MNKENTSSKLITSLFDTGSLTRETTNILNSFDEIIQGVRPLNSRQLQQLPENIRNLSHQLTDDRASRRLGYMNDNIQLSSYVRYYTWWNLVRLTRLFANIPATVFPTSDCTCLDLGSGPLTVVTALWLARPELRKLKLTWYCLDVSANSMALGEDIFLSIAACTGEEPWHIVRVKGAFGTTIKQKANFLTCANMFNELDQASDMPPEFTTKKYYEQIQRYCENDAGVLLVEPGVPKAARTLSLLRTRFIKDGRTIAAPCPHAEECPMSGFKAYTGSKNKWCNFAFSTEDAPAKLQKLSVAAKLPKERATLSFIAVEHGHAELVSASPDTTSIRIASDKLRLPNYMCGYYACTRFGLALVRLPDENNKKLPKPPFRPQSGDLIQVKIKTPDSLPKDEKSGAVIIEI
ncbi:small ribosomal subunit Rsm22 [Treponema bryantii]|uniref:Small ribosomal subunit Rsm22 n=1 Tax=Treponema bryantii TaxID=163 RepID=A0A1I3I4S2_9SPIR|nr:small ribosomal subunit Rsm22 family protein [Treponema bryantii]SFI42869.1 small ribosomal subunit Rsm22 [Treponema bryantii]